MNPLLRIKGRRCNDKIKYTIWGTRRGTSFSLFNGTYAKVRVIREHLNDLDEAVERGKRKEKRGKLDADDRQLTTNN